jgi:hypothetical protein
MIPGGCWPVSGCAGEASNHPAIKCEEPALPARLPAKGQPAESTCPVCAKAIEPKGQSTSPLSGRSTRPVTRRRRSSRVGIPAPGLRASGLTRSPTPRKRVPPSRAATRPARRPAAASTARHDTGYRTLVPTAQGSATRRAGRRQSATAGSGATSAPGALQGASWTKVQLVASGVTARLCSLACTPASRVGATGAETPVNLACRIRQRREAIMDKPILRLLIQERLADGRLPHDDIPRVWGGQAAGRPVTAAARP